VGSHLRPFHKVLKERVQGRERKWEGTLLFLRPTLGGNRDQQEKTAILVRCKELFSEYVIFMPRWEEDPGGSGRIRSRVKGWNSSGGQGRWLVVAEASFAPGKAAENC